MILSIQLRRQHRRPIRPSEGSEPIVFWSHRSADVSNGIRERNSVHETNRRFRNTEEPSEPSTATRQSGFWSYWGWVPFFGNWIEIFKKSINFWVFQEKKNIILILKNEEFQVFLVENLDLKKINFEKKFAVFFIEFGDFLKFSCWKLKRNLRKWQQKINLKFKKNFANFPSPNCWNFLKILKKRPGKI